MTIFSASQKVRAFCQSRSGSYTLLTGVASTAIFAAVAFGINIGQMYQVRSSLQSALDAAVTSTARDLTTRIVAEKDARAKVLAFLNANMNTSFTNADGFSLDAMVIDRGSRTITATAHATVGLALPFVSDPNPVVRVNSAAVYSDKTVEVAMMLDTTGSMKDYGKIGDLKTSAKNAVNKLLDGQDPANPRIRVSIVPYAEAVNTGALAASSVFKEVPGGLNLPPALDDIVSIAFGQPTDNCATERKLVDGSADFSNDGPDAQRRNAKGKIYLAKVNRDNRMDTCPSAALVPLTADKAKLIKTIDAFTANGVTAGAIAAQWGYYMLSSDWAASIKAAGLGSGPAKFDKTKTAKVAILMTDGQFNTAFAGVADDMLTTDKERINYFVPGTRSRAYAQAICTNMKKDGIEIYTIGFDLDAPDMSAAEKAQARSVLKDCSSPDTNSVKHFYDAANGAELDDAFSEIVQNTERLALTR